MPAAQFNEGLGLPEEVQTAISETLSGPKPATDAIVGAYLIERVLNGPGANHLRGPASAAARAVADVGKQIADSVLSPEEVRIKLSIAQRRDDDADNYRVPGDLGYGSQKGAGSALRSGCATIVNAAQEIHPRHFQFGPVDRAKFDSDVAAVTAEVERLTSGPAMVIEGK